MDIDTEIEEIILTQKQRIILRLARKRGYITLSEIYKIYSDPKYGKRALVKLVDMGVLIPDQLHGKYNYNYPKKENQTEMRRFI